MRRITATAALAIAALSLSGCTGGTSAPEAAATSADSAPSTYESTTAPAAPSTAPASSSPTSEDTDLVSDLKMEFADTSMNVWLNAEGAHSLDGFAEPYSLITEWESLSGDWTIQLTVSDAIEDRGEDPEQQLRMIAAEMMQAINARFNGAKAITATTEDGEYSATVRREES